MNNYMGKAKLARGNNRFFSRRTKLRKSRPHKQSKRTVKKIKQRVKDKIKIEKDRIDNELMSRGKYIDIIKKIMSENRTANPESIYLLLEKLGSEDLISKILNNIEEINNNLNDRLNTLLSLLIEIDNEDPGLYDVDSLIDRTKSLLVTVDMNSKTEIIKEILENLDSIYELEIQKMETGYQNDRIIEILDNLFD